ncbi:hypothetical protein Tery_2819 [Trichodesmium erythraeum IMS101]|uniref:Uncharacterized protein n=2 Tax=Trichodesmium erythraeum TaxID=1206 RepID=Q110S9_TRIEI|nr:hypothetical protein [Trichodesmium erythraeum GBRTRLIN201]
MLPRLSYRITTDEKLFIEDIRWVTSKVFTFNTLEANVYQIIDSPTSLKQVLRKLRGTPGEELTTIEVQGILERFIEAELVLYDRTFYLSIAILDSAVDLPTNYTVISLRGNLLINSPKKLKRLKFP